MRANLKIVVIFSLCSFGIFAMRDKMIYVAAWAKLKILQKATAATTM